MHSVSSVVAVVGCHRDCTLEVWRRGHRAFPEEPREGQQGTALGRAEGSRGLWRGFPPQNLRSLHLLREDASQPMAGPGAPSRPPPSAPPRPACHGSRRTQGPAPGDIACEELAGFCAVHPRRRLARTAAPVRPSPPGTTAASGATSQARREAVRRAGDAAIPAEGAAWGQRAPRARPSPPPEPRGACARRGRGRTCVCLSPAPGGHAGGWLQAGVISSAILGCARS